MSACAMLSYNGVTPTAWQCGIKTAADYGVAITTNVGSATASGFTIAWNYDPGARTLSIQCTGRPFWAPCSTVNGKINDAVEACLKSENIEMAHMVPG
jgi:hypothetical protein